MASMEQMQAQERGQKKVQVKVHQMAKAMGSL
jgi:hypothetical protein